MICCRTFKVRSDVQTNHPSKFINFDKMSSLESLIKKRKTFKEISVTQNTENSQDWSSASELQFQEIQNVSNCICIDRVRFMNATQAWLARIKHSLNIMNTNIIYKSACFFCRVPSHLTAPLSGALCWGQETPPTLSRRDVNIYFAPSDLGSEGCVIFNSDGET